MTADRPGQERHVFATVLFAMFSARTQRVRYGYYLVYMYNNMYRIRIGIRVHCTDEVGTRNRRNRSQRNPFRLSATTCRIFACLAAWTRLLLLCCDYCTALNTYIIIILYRNIIAI